MGSFLERLRGRYGRQVDLKVQVRGYRMMTPDVLADLAEFCGAIDPAPKDGGEFVQGRAAGRRDVWLRIMAHRVLRETEVYALLKGEPIATAQERYS